MVQDQLPKPAPWQEKKTISFCAIGGDEMEGGGGALVRVVSELMLREKGETSNVLTTLLPLL